jgi:RHS repeat-associated protein
LLSADVNNEGGVDGADVTAFNSIWATGESPRAGLCMNTGIRVGYAGYQWDGSVNNGSADTGTFGERNYTGGMAGLYHVRHRVYDSELGRWTRRDPIGYVDGMGLYAYVRGYVTTLVDAFGLRASSYGAKGCSNGSSWSATPVSGIVLPYRLAPCNTPQREATCGRWAAQECSSRAGTQTPGCYSACVDAATERCTGSSCDAADGGASCTAEGVRAAGRCNQTSTRRDCFTTCIDGILVPGGACYWPCRSCNVVWGDPPGAAIFCAGSCAAFQLPGIPEWAQGPYVTCVKGCLLGLGVWSAGTCSGCIGCVSTEAYRCHQACY